MSCQVNTAARMASHALPGMIQATAEAADAIRHHSNLVVTERGVITVKSKGEMLTFHIERTGVAVPIAPHASVRVNGPLGVVPAPGIQPGSGSRLSGKDVQFSRDASGPGAESISKASLDESGESLFGLGSLLTSVAGNASNAPLWPSLDGGDRTRGRRQALKSSSLTFGSGAKPDEAVGTIQGKGVEDEPSSNALKAPPVVPAGSLSWYRHYLDGFGR